MKVMIMGIGDAIAHSLNLVIANQSKTCKNNLKYSFISTSVIAINNTLLNTTNNIDYLEIGRDITKGLGANGEPEKALKAFYESEKEIDKFLNNELEKIELVIVITTLGGGTGTVITPLINKKIKKFNIPLINIVTLPFEWEGNKRNIIANKYISEFYKTSDSVITVNNTELQTSTEKLIKRKISIIQALKISDYKCAKTIKQVYESLLYKKGLEEIYENRI
jgi:cell division GTPase FtsZ